MSYRRVVRDGNKKILLEYGEQAKKIMGVWKVKDFNAICRDLGLDKACLYADSLSTRWLSARYHKSNIQQNMDEMKDIKSFLKNMSYYSFTINFELDALMLSLNSIFDILGQLINECFISPKIPIDRVKFDKVVNHNSIPDDLRQILKSIKKDPLYQKIKAYANISKHRYVIQGDNNIDFTQIPTTISYKSTEFEYNGKWHELTHDTAFRCWKFVGESLIQAGNMIQELVKSGSFTESSQTQT